jgi:alpha-aminoadipic semialdehyde synthase
MRPKIGVRREDKSLFERRAPLTPEDAGRLIAGHGIDVVVQESPHRVFDGEEYRKYGVPLSEKLTDAQVIFGIKEIPVEQLEAGKTYSFFAHVIKGQAYNMPMLRRALELGCTLIDYERIIDGTGKRLIFFGRYAGIAGALETLWALGQRLQLEGHATPLAEIRRPTDYRDIDQAKSHVAEVGSAIHRHGLPREIGPLTIGVTGYGNVSQGVWEVLRSLQVVEVTPDQLKDLHQPGKAERGALYAATFREEHMVRPASSAERFDCQRYYECPDRYEPIFERYVPSLSAVINGIYWDQRYPRLMTKRYLAQHWREAARKLIVVGDISCDVEGSIEFTVKSTMPDEPTFVYEPDSGTAKDGLSGDGPVVMAVEILPAELPRDSSIGFSQVLSRFVPAIARADYGLPFEELQLPEEIKRAVVAHRGQLAPDYQYIGQYL